MIKSILRPGLKVARDVLVDIRNRLGNKSYSQEGEDRVLASLLFKLHGAEHRKVGFYIDIGAHHPYRFSNTFLFYRRGWRGINIDAMPGSMRDFKNSRARDSNIEIGIGEKSTDSDFYVFNEPALNTFDASLAKARCTDNWHIVNVQKVRIEPLSKLLDEHVASGQEIDFLSVDVEGLDLSVLASNDWHKYRPLVVLAETFGKSLDDMASDPVYKYMKSVGYELYAKTVNTSFFVDGMCLK